MRRKLCKLNGYDSSRLEQRDKYPSSGKFNQFAVYPFGSKTPCIMISREHIIHICPGQKARHIGYVFKEDRHLFQCVGLRAYGLIFESFNLLRADRRKNLFSGSTVADDGSTGIHGVCDGSVV